MSLASLRLPFAVSASGRTGRGEANIAAFAGLFLNLPESWRHLQTFSRWHRRVSSPTPLLRCVKILIVLGGGITWQIIGLSPHLGERTAPTGRRHKIESPQNPTPRT